MSFRAKRRNLFSLPPAPPGAFLLSSRAKSRDLSSGGEVFQTAANFFFRAVARKTKFLRPFAAEEKGPPPSPAPPPPHTHLPCKHVVCAGRTEVQKKTRSSFNDRGSEEPHGVPSGEVPPNRGLRNAVRVNSSCGKTKTPECRLTPGGPKNRSYLLSQLVGQYHRRW